MCFFFPPVREIINCVSPFAIGFPSLAIFLNALPLMFSAYIIAFGDFVTAETLITEADKARRDEKIDFNADRSSLISGIRNVIEALISPYTQLCGLLWAAVTASVAQRYQEGREEIDSIFSGAGTLRVTTFIAVATIPVVTLVRPILPVALSITLLVQGFVCARVGMSMIRTNEEMGGSWRYGRCFGHQRSCLGVSCRNIAFPAGAVSKRQRMKLRRVAVCRNFVFDARNRFQAPGKS